MSEKVLTHLLNCINDRHFAYLKIGNYYLQTPRLGFRVIAKLCAYGIFKQFLNNISFLLSAYFICSLTFLKVQLAIGPSHKKTGCHHELPVPVFLKNLNLRCVQCLRINHDQSFLIVTISVFIWKSMSIACFFHYFVTNTKSFYYVTCCPFLLSSLLYRFCMNK
jgi:hypothetical protein